MHPTLHNHTYTDLLPKVRPSIAHSMIVECNSIVQHFFHSVRTRSIGTITHKLFKVNLLWDRCRVFGDSCMGGPDRCACDLEDRTALNISVRTCGIVHGFSYTNRPSSTAWKSNLRKTWKLVDGLHDERAPLPFLARIMRSLGRSSKRQVESRKPCSQPVRAEKESCYETQRVYTD